MDPSRLLSNLYHYMWNEILYPVPPGQAAAGRPRKAAPEGQEDDAEYEYVGEDECGCGYACAEKNRVPGRDT